MKTSALAALALGLTSSHAWASPTAPPPSPSLRATVDEIASAGSAILQIDANHTARLVRDQSQCPAGEQLVAVWINIADARQHLTGYTCEGFVE